jgi:hypothetical protein
MKTMLRLVLLAASSASDLLRSAKPMSAGNKTSRERPVPGFDLRIERIVKPPMEFLLGVGKNTHSENRAEAPFPQRVSVK